MAGRSSGGKRSVLDWSGDEVVEWTKPRWYEKLATLIVLIIVAAYFISQVPTPLMMVLSVIFVITWYFFLMFVIEDVKTKIMAWRIKRAAVRRWHRKYLFKNLFEKYPWLETYLREVRRAEELEFPYVPDIIIRDPATAKIEIRRPPPTRWWIPQQTQIQQAPTTPKTPPEQAPREEAQRQIQQQATPPPPPPQPREPRRRRERKIPLPPELEDAYRAIKRLVESLSIEETHTHCSGSWRR